MYFNRDIDELWKYRVTKNTHNVRIQILLRRFANFQGTVRKAYDKSKYTSQVVGIKQSTVSEQFALAF